jgi:hypothetical protein
MIDTTFDFDLLVLEKKILKKNQCIVTLSLLFPLEKGYPLCLNKPEFPIPKDDLCQVWLKLDQCFWRRRFLNESIPFLQFCDYLSFNEYRALHLNKVEFPSSKIGIVLVLH